MKRKEALQNLKIVGWLFIVVGFISLSATIIFWKHAETAPDLIMQSSFRVALIYFGWFILKSQKVLSF